MQPSDYSLFQNEKFDNSAGILNKISYKTFQKGPTVLAFVNWSEDIL